ncbi:ligase-associated DNA damage response endonuclease PdeM [Flavobacterium wongokense]|uniref:ligase-associated DNA damage response endonuclease PdeM n=1 Tax=Flavobacterium wongokense TaxID=2910674 RepID=UPI001F3098EB|nr:ligase-associated DNA damage response endonuclease PdeM [Flavobacterium sp. WG47]MCF6131034.1 ligase-associated DNA damage response endonuclease PdeM [Flavobacterium sp. WG47]
MKIEIRNNNFILHSSGAVFWKEQKILLISDVHLGKIAHFRKHGLAIPGNAIAENFNRLDEVVALQKPEKIIFLGDLFHSKINNEWNLFAYWVNKIQTEIVLVEGNHDIIEQQNYSDLNIEIHKELILDDFLLTHHPVENEWFFNFCGHVHPGIKLKDVGRQSLKLACFFHKEKQMILPAFGEFTGKYFMRPYENDKVYAIANNEVIRVF